VGAHANEVLRNTIARGDDKEIAAQALAPEQALSILSNTLTLKQILSLPHTRLLTKNLVFSAQKADYDISKEEVVFRDGIRSRDFMLKVELNFHFPRFSSEQYINLYYYLYINELANDVSDFHAKVYELRTRDKQSLQLLKF
jgi:hypothetical protein